jgi:hypothetical protein
MYKSAVSTVFAIPLWILTLLAACSSSSGSAPAPSDASTSGSGGLLTCTPPAGSTGNSKNVGAYCTKNGGQCSKFSSSEVQCSIDLSSSGSNFCILIGCSQDSDCGEDACCTGEAGNPIKACVPNGCFDGGVCVAVGLQ